MTSHSPYPQRWPLRSAVAICGPVALLLLAGCAATPDAGPRPVPRTAGSVAASQSLPGSSQGEWPADDWWQAYGDPQLDALVTEGLANSPDIAAAVARLRKAEALAQQADAALLPTLDAKGTAGFTKQSYNIGYPPEFVALLPHGWKSEAEADVTLGFDPDLWGKNRAALAAATSERQAAAVEAHEATLMLATSITQAYADLGAAIALRDNRQAALNTRTASQSLTGERLREGLETRGSLRTSQAQSDSARADLAAADQSVLLRRHQLAVLLGAGPDRGLTITPPRLAPLGTHDLPADVTTELLGRRADVVAARMRVEAEASRIKVARADFYPSFRLDALAGLQSLPLGQLFNSGSTYGTVGPAVSLPLFHGGALRAAYRGARADYDLAVSDYDHTVLTAYQQTADAVATRNAQARQLDEARAAASTSEEAYSIAMARYRGGLSTYLDALIVEDRLVQARQALVVTDAAYRSADIALIRALGGGFTKNPRVAASTPNTIQNAKDAPHE